MGANFLLLNTKHLGASLIELVGLIEVLLCLLKTELEDLVPLACLRGDDYDAKVLLSLEHIVYELLVAVLAIDRVATDAAQMADCDVGSHGDELKPQYFNERFLKENCSLFYIVLLKDLVAGDLDLFEKNFEFFTVKTLPFLLFTYGWEE